MVRTQCLLQWKTPRKLAVAPEQVEKVLDLELGGRGPEWLWPRFLGWPGAAAALPHHRRLTIPHFAGIPGPFRLVLILLPSSLGDSGQKTAFGSKRAP